MARVDLGMGEEEFWRIHPGLLFRMLDLKDDRVGQASRRARLRTAAIIAALVNVHLAKDQRPWTEGDVYEDLAEPADPEEDLRAFEAWASMHNVRMKNREAGEE